MVPGAQRKRLGLSDMPLAEGDFVYAAREFGGQIEVLPRNSGAERFARGDARASQSREALMREIHEQARRCVKHPSARSSTARVETWCAETRTLPAPSRRRLADSSLIGVLELAAYPANNVLRFFGTATPLLDPRLVAHVDHRDWQAGILLWRRNDTRCQLVIGVDEAIPPRFDGQIKCPIEQNSRRRLQLGDVHRWNPAQRPV